MQRVVGGSGVVVVVVALTACGTMSSTSSGTSSSSSSGTPGPIAVDLGFDALVDTTTFSCAQPISGVGTSASTVTVRDLRFYIHDLKLIPEDGSADVPVTLADNDFQHDGVALVDLEDGTGGCVDGTAATHASVTGTAPAGTYTGVAFTLGVPFEQNHQDSATAHAPLNLTSMFWTWNGGYKFLKLDVSSAGMPGGWLLHLGSTGCETGNTVTSCTNPNRVEVRLPGFELGHHTVGLDLKALLSTSNVDVNMAGAPGCMSGQTDPECAAVFARFGLPIGAAPASSQLVFAPHHHTH
jgi:uncharacterized repeat protein (TIGR04052 family)